MANIGEVQGHGDSAAWNAQKANVLRIFEAFRVSTPEVLELYPSPWSDLSEEVGSLRCAVVIVLIRCTRDLCSQHPSR